MKRVPSMKVNEIGSYVPVEPESLFEMPNLYPSTTGLPMTVWVSPRRNAHQDVRVRVNITNGEQMDIGVSGSSVPVAGAMKLIWW